MDVSSRSSTRERVRSISLPCRSHSTTDRIEKELNKINASERSLSSASKSPSAEAICSGLSQLAQLYVCMDDLFSASETQQLISSHRNEKWVEELLERSVKFLDICSILKEIMPQMKEHITDLHCALRRRKGDSSIESSISRFNCFRKKTKKDIKGLIRSLKQVENNMISLSLTEYSENNHLVAVIRIVREVGALTVSFFHSVSMFLAVPVLSSKLTSRWSGILRRSKGAVAPCTAETVGKNTNELERLDAALQRYHTTNEGVIQNLKDRLEALDVRANNINSGLESMYRQLIATRGSLLNMVSSY